MALENGQQPSAAGDPLRPAAPPATIGVLLSGGLDSSILLAHLAQAGERVQPIYVAGGLFWEQAELAAARAYLSRLAHPRVAALVVLELPLADLYGRHWSVDGRHTPDGSTPDEAVYLPGRNPLLLVKSRLWCQLNGIGRLALGTLQNNPFADATDDFFASFAAVLDQAMLGSVSLERPLARRRKVELLRLGAELPLELTLSCLAPRDAVHCGRCNKCHERQTAFAAAGLADPTRYLRGAVSVRAAAGAPQ